MKLKERALQIGDIESMDVQEQQKWILDLGDKLLLLEDKALCRCFLDGDKIVCVVGILPMGPAHGEVFSIMATGFKQYALALFRRINVLMDRLHDSGFEKLTTVVNITFKEAQRWCKLIGFKEIGQESMDFFGAETDVFLYERINHGIS